MEDGLKIAKKKIKRMRPDWSNKKIDIILSREGAIKKDKTEYVQPVLEQPADVDKSRWMLAAIKMAYEYACEKMGSAYTKDEIAVKFSDWLYDSVKGKKEYSDKEFSEMNRYCNVFDLKALNILRKRIMIDKLSKAKHVISICADMDGKLICTIRILDEDILTFTVLISKDAGKYLVDKGIFITMILEDGEKVEF